MLTAAPDFQGATNPPQFLIHLRPGEGKKFAKNDLVRIRLNPVRRPQASDPFANILLRIDFTGANEVSVSYVTPGNPIDPTLYNPSNKYALVAPLVVSGTDVALVAQVVKAFIGTANGPLNGLPGTQGLVCAVGQLGDLPSKQLVLKKAPKDRGDIVGLYEGANYHDCGVFRPAGRCKMRKGMSTTQPFCHVCRYVIVDTIDPTLHGDLDKLYPQVQA